MKFTDLSMSKKILVFSTPLPAKILFQCKFWHLRKGVKNYFMLLDFLGLLFESRLPFLVLFLLLSSSKRLPPVFLYMQIYISPLCCISGIHLDLIPCSTEISGKLHVVFCRPPCLQIPAYALRFCCLWQHSLKKYKLT